MKIQIAKNEKHEKGLQGMRNTKMGCKTRVTRKLMIVKKRIEKGLQGMRNTKTD